MTSRIQVDKSKLPRTATTEKPRYDLSVPSLVAERIEMDHSLLPRLQLFWVTRRLLLRAGIYAFLASTLVAFLIPVRYESVTRVMPPDNESSSTIGLLAAMAGSSGTGLGGLGSLAGDLLGVKNSGALFVGILNSDTVKDALVDKFQLKRAYHDSKIEDARKDLADHTDISVDRKSGIISVAVTDHDPKRATAMAQAYVGELDWLVARVSTSSARRERIFLEDRLQHVKADLDTAAKNFSDFASRNTAIDIPAQGRAMLAAAATLQGELIAAQTELSGLQQVYTDNNVRVREAEARVNELDKKLHELGGEGTESQLENDNSLYPSIRKLPLLGVTYADLYRQTKLQETVYELLTRQHELAKVEEAKEIPTVKVLDVAMTPTKISFPPRALVVILGTVLGITLAMTWIVGKSRWESADPNDPRKLFAMEVFNTVQTRIPRFSQNGLGAKSNGNRSESFEDRPGNADRGEAEEPKIE